MNGLGAVCGPRVLCPVVRPSRIVHPDILSGVRFSRVLCTSDFLNQRYNITFELVNN